MKTIFSCFVSAQILGLTLVTAQAVPLSVVNVSAPSINCIFDPTCTNVVTDTSGTITLPGVTGSGSLQSRTFTGNTGAAAAGLFGYEYRIDLTGVTGTNCIDQFAVDFGAVVGTLAFVSNGAPAQVYVVTNGGVGTVGLAGADQEGSTVTFTFATPVCAGQSSFFIGLVSAAGPTNVEAFIHETSAGGVLTVAARAPQGAPPCTITCSTNVTVCNDPGMCGAVVYFAPPVATNCDGLAVGCLPPSGSFFPVGTNSVLCAAMDEATNLISTCTFEVVVQDCEPPVIHSIAASPNVLWPPNHKMEKVNVNVVATDNCHLVGCSIISVTSNESVNTHGSGHTSPDWQITGDLKLNLRAERSGQDKAGRVYTITVACVDEAMNVSTAQVNVTVPHDQGQGQGGQGNGHGNGQGNGNGNGHGNGQGNDQGNHHGRH